MLRAQQAGAVIMPAIPSYYHQPKTIDDLVAQYVYRVLAQMGLAQKEMYRWEGQSKSKASEA
jgi:4-hydroxy-3-polyprenylbenzoate decarboxylase